jgi:hypothetical protein
VKLTVDDITRGVRDGLDDADRHERELRAAIAVVRAERTQLWKREQELHRHEQDLFDEIHRLRDHDNVDADLTW